MPSLYPVLWRYLPVTPYHPNRLEIDLLLAHALKVPRSYLYLYPDQPLTNNQLKRFAELFERRLLGEPMAYILGKQSFWTLELSVNPYCLIPRPDTELLVETTLSKLSNSQFYQVLDLGTGCGAVALALAKSCPKWQLTGIDNEPKVLTLACQNKQRNALTNVHFHKGDWFNGLHSVINQKELSYFHTIVANPPYVASNDKHLYEGDVRFEPHYALVSGPDGLDALRIIIQQAGHYLQAPGWLLLEHGYNQGLAVRTLMTQAGFTNVDTYKDLERHERVTCGQLKKTET